MKTNHTGGDWTFQNFPSCENFNGVPVIEVHTHFDTTPLGEWIAKVRGNTDAERLSNAKLIAASPKMLAELKANHDFLLNLYSTIGNRDFNKENALQLLRDRMATQLDIIKVATE